MNILPRIISLPKERLLRCPRFIEKASDIFGIEEGFLLDVFYDFIELSIVDPENHPDFSWFIVTDDDEDPDMFWCVTDSHMKMAFKFTDSLLEDGEFGDSNTIGNRPTLDKQGAGLTKFDYKTVSALSQTITDNLRKKLGNDDIIPILREIPTPYNNYLFARPKVLVGEYKLEEDEEFKPFIMEQVSDDEWYIFFSDEDFATHYIKRQIKEYLNTDEEITLKENPSDGNDFLEDSIGLASGSFRLESWDESHYEEFDLLYDPNDFHKCEVIIAYVATEVFVKDHISDAMECKLDEIILLTPPNKDNNYYSLPSDESLMVVPFEYDSKEYKAVIHPDYDGDLSDIITEIYNAEDFD